MANPTVMILPRDVIVHMFSYLEAPELCKLSGVSKPICEISEDNTLWRPLVEREWGVHTKEQEEHLLAEQVVWEKKLEEKKAAAKAAAAATATAAPAK